MKKQTLLMASLCTAYLCADADADAAKTPKPYHQGEPLPASYAAAYNAPAAPAVSHKLDQKWISDWSFFADAAFTYWYINEEGLRIATDGVTTGAAADVRRPVNDAGHFPDFNYKPGFKVGLGLVCCDEWVYRAGYTWVRSHVHGHGLNTPKGSKFATDTAAATQQGTAVFAVDNWFFGKATETAFPAASSMSSEWKLNLDIVDITGSRPWYQGRKLIISPFGGLELAFIYQDMEVSLAEVPAQFVSTYKSGFLESHTTADSWGVGPVVGCKTTQLLPWHFYVEGAGAFSLLYTTYTTLSHREKALATTYYEGPYTYSYHHYHAMRPTSSLELGLGWGKYFCDDGCYFDFSATYEFTIYWAQNMLRKLVDDFANITSQGSTAAGIINTRATTAPAADLFTQGLTLTARINF